MTTPPQLLSLEEIVLKLYDVEGLKFGSFTMRTGEKTPVYIDMRVMWSYPDLVRSVSEHLWQEVQKHQGEYDCVCGLPYQGIPLATHLCTQYGVPMIMKRQQPKQYGTKKLLEGHFKMGDRCLILDDVVMTGGTLVKDIPVFQNAGLAVPCCVAFIDRDQGGCQRTQKTCGVDVHCVLTIEEIFEYLLKAGRLNQATVDDTRAYLQANRFDNITTEICEKTEDDQQL